MNGTIDRTIPTLYPDWTMSFDIYPLGTLTGMNNLKLIFKPCVISDLNEIFISGFLYLRIKIAPAYQF